MRSGEKGNIRIYYQDFIQWMIDCARLERPERDIPSWAYRFVKASTPKTLHRDPKNPDQLSFL